MKRRSSNPERKLVHFRNRGLRIALALALTFATPALAQSQTPDAQGATATDGPGGAASWTTGNKLVVGTSAGVDSKVWFTVAKGITSEVFYPRLDVPNIEDMQYVVTDGSTFVDLERDATSHAISMPSEKALEYTVTNTDMRPSPRYRITNTYIADPSRDSLLIQTRFESLDGGVYRLYLLANPSMAGGGANNTAWWDGTNSALMASGTRPLFGSSTTVVSALKVGNSNGFVGDDNGYSAMASDCNVELHKNMALISRFDNASDGNVVQCGEIGGIGADTTFTVALGYGGDAATALAAVNGSLAAGFREREAAYDKGWGDYVDGLRPAPSSVSSDTLRRRVYYTAAMALHAAEDKTFRGANVAGFGTPWGDFVSGNQPNDGYHRVWARDLYQQATGLIAAGDSSQALRMAQFLWSSQFVGTTTPGDGTTYQPGSFPRYTPVSGIGAATARDLGCCEQLDEEAFGILLAWMTGLSDSSTYQKIKTTADHIVGVGPATTERWEEQFGQSPSSVAAIIAGLIAAADIARQNNDPASAARWESMADSLRSSLADRTYTTDGYWDGHRYFERIDPTQDPNSAQTIHFNEGDFLAHDVADFGFLDLVRLGVAAPDDANVSNSLSPSASASDGNSIVQVTMPNGDIYFHRYNHDSYGESNSDCAGWPSSPNAANRYGRFWPVLSGERGEYEIAGGRSANVYLQSMADAANDGYFLPEQVWDRPDIACFTAGRPTGSAAPLNWAEGQYLRLAQSIDAGTNLDTPAVVKAKYRGAGPILGYSGRCIDDASASTDDGTAIQVFACNGTAAQSWSWNSNDGTLRALNKCLDVTGGATASGTPVQLWDCNGTGAQEWRWRQQTRLVNPQSGRCLNVAGGSVADGARLEIADCDDTAGQVWWLP
jgi:glucoamylase